METGYKFNKGDKVKLISGRHGSDSSNPVWDGYAVAGHVQDIFGDDHELPFRVVWENGKDNVYSGEDLVLFEEEKTRTLTTKEDYLDKLLEGVEVMQKVKEMNLLENKMIDDFIQSLVEEMKPEEQREKEKKEREEQEKKEQEEKKEEESKKEKESGEASEKKSEPLSSETSGKEEPKGKEELANEVLKKMIETMEAAKKEAGKGGIGKEVVEKAFEELRKAQGIPDEAGIRKPLTEATTGLEIETPYEGGEAQGRNKSVKKDSSGRLFAKPNR